MSDVAAAFAAITLGVFVVGGGIGGCMYVAPQYNVYNQQMTGKAELARAEQNRQIRIMEARAEEEAAILFSKAEVARAHGVAEANAIVADGLGGPEGYLRYLWIQNLGSKDNGVIYIPTEAGLPILEAGRLKQDVKVSVQAPAGE